MRLKESWSNDDIRQPAGKEFPPIQFPASYMEESRSRGDGKSGARASTRPVVGDVNDYDVIHLEHQTKLSTVTGS